MSKENLIDLIYNLELENTKIKEKLEILEEELNFYKYDQLTGLQTRHDFYLKVKSKLSEHDLFFLFLIDINNLHIINKEEGYRIGDKVIKSVADEITQQLKDIDNIFIYRIGGDEFTVISNVDVSEKINEIKRVSFCFSEVSQKDEFGNIFDKLDECLIKLKKYKISEGQFKDRRKKKVLLLDKIYHFLYPIFYEERRKKRV